MSSDQPGPKFDFVTIVRVVANEMTVHEGIVGMEGPVIGMSQYEDTGEYCYAVFLDSGTVSLDATDLEATGRTMPREEFYDGSHIGVRPDGTVSWTDLRDEWALGAAAWAPAAQRRTERRAMRAAMAWASPGGTGTTGVAQ